MASPLYDSSTLVGTPAPAPTPSPDPTGKVASNYHSPAIHPDHDAAPSLWSRLTARKRYLLIPLSLLALLALALGLGLGLGLRRSVKNRHAGNGQYYTGYDKAVVESPSYYPTPQGGSDKRWQDHYKKAAEMVSKMSLAEKINITTGTGWQMGPCVGNTGSADSVGFPGLCLQDGPLGVRFADSVTVFPAGITVASTWDRDLMFKRGQALGAEMRGKGVNVMLGPAMMGNRMPAGGRNWEGFGADPVLSGVAVGETVKGIQGEGVIACAKHYIGNEQEIFRQAVEARGQNWAVDEAISANIGGRALREIYAWPFMDAVESGVGSVMCSYNRESLIIASVMVPKTGFIGLMKLQRLTTPMLVKIAIC